MLVEALARQPGTILHRELIGDDWTRDQHLLAILVDVLAAANWQRGGGKGSKPKPISPLAKPKKTDEDRHGDDLGRDPAHIADLLDRYRTGAWDKAG